MVDNKGYEIASLRNEVRALTAALGVVRNAVSQLENEKDNLRQAVRKLKIENVRTKEKLKKLQEHYKNQAGGDAGSEEDDFPDYDEIGRDYLLIGGSQDPLGNRYEVLIQDGDGVQHRSAERYCWYKMAEHFGDFNARDAILNAETTSKAEEAMKEIKGFQERQWNEVKLAVWETGQRLKLEQVRWIANVLVETGSSYIAVAHQDKMIGSGWRKHREEASKPMYWDGQNAGGKFLMRYRKKLQGTQEWAGPSEKEEAQRKVAECKRFAWRRTDHQTHRGGRGGRFNGSRGRGGFRPRTAKTTDGDAATTDQNGVVKDTSSQE